MLRIGSGLSGVDLAAQRGLMNAIEQLSLSSIRLAAMRRISRASEDPSGLIAVESLQSELVSIEAAQRNASRAAGMVHAADSGLAQTGELLRDVKANLLEVAGGGLSDDEIRAKQIEIDAALDAINRIGRTTTYGGRKLLDGSADPASSGEAITFLLTTNAEDTVSLSLPTINTTALGGSDGTLDQLAGGGDADLASGELSKAVAIVDDAEDQVLDARARAGAFEKYTIDSSRHRLDAMEETLAQGISLLRDTDVAHEAANYVRAQILAQSALSTLLLVGERRSLISGLFQEW